MRTSVEVAKDGTRRVYHERVAPPDKRRPEHDGRVTHAWTHADTPAIRAACDACQRGVLPKEAR